MSEKESAWRTAITEIQPNQVRVRGYDIAELMTNLTFGGAVYLAICGELPSAPISRSTAFTASMCSSASG